MNAVVNLPVAQNDREIKQSEPYLELKGMYDRAIGLDPQSKKDSYLRGYGKQYEIEAVISGRSLEIF